MGVHDSLAFMGCHISWRDAKFPRVFYSGMPISQGCRIPCDTGYPYFYKYGYPGTHIYCGNGYPSVKMGTPL